MTAFEGRDMVLRSCGSTTVFAPCTAVYRSGLALWEYSGETRGSKCGRSGTTAYGSTATGRLYTVAVQRRMALPLQYGCIP